MMMTIPIIRICLEDEYNDNKRAFEYDDNDDDDDGDDDDDDNGGGGGGSVWNSMTLKSLWR